MDPSKTSRILCTFLLLLSLFAGCTNAASAPNADTAAPINGGATDTPALSADALLREIYTLPSPDYAVYSSGLLDTYFISCALYFGFDSQEILPNAQDDALHLLAKEYFSPYQDHPFIKGLEPYVDTGGRAHRDGAVFPLLMYIFSIADYGMGVDMVQTDVFQDGEAFNAFLQSLLAFYQDTHAEEFFRRVKLQREMEAYLIDGFQTRPIDALLTEMEAYVGNKGTLFQGQNVKYRSVMTLYRPFNASFYTIQFGNDIYLIGQQSPSDESKKTDSFDMDQTVITTVHELLHSYINQPVFEQRELISSLSQGQEKTAYTSAPMYQGMEWDRIVDEHVVRAVETAVFRRVLQDEEKAFDSILKREIELGGMTKLQAMYETLPAYEAAREEYPSIDAYLPQIIEAMFR